MMFVDKLLGILPFLALGALGLANLLAAVGALRGTRRARSWERVATSYCATSTSG